MRIKKLILVSFCFLTSFVYSQFDEGKHLSRYWNYRYALNGDKIDPSYPKWEPGFVEVGSGPGYSIPFKTRERYFSKYVYHPQYPSFKGDPVTNWQCIDGIPYHRRPGIWINNQTNENKFGSLHSGDAPTEHGKYLIVLATELKNLVNDAEKYNTNNIYTLKSLNENLYNQIMTTYFELNFALNAFNRLDGIAETQFGQGPKWDGFFVRDDIPSDFNDDCKFGCAQNILGQDLFNKNVNQNHVYFEGNSFYSTLSGHVTARELGTYDCGAHTFDDLTHCVMSQDQMYKVLIGVIYAKLFAGDFEQKYGNFFQVSKNAHGIIDRTLWKLFPNYNIFRPDGSWVECGGNCIAHSLPIWGIYNRFGDGDMQGGAQANAIVQGAPLWYGQRAALLSSYSQAQFTTLTGNPMFIGAYHSWEMYGFNCVMDDWGAFAWPNSLKIFGDELAKNQEKPYDYQINKLLEPLREVMHETTYNQSLIPDLKDYLQSDFFIDCEHDTRKQENPGDKFYSERSGLDYMIGYNLYKLIQSKTDNVDMASGQYSNFIPMFDRTITNVFPSNATYNFNSTPNTWPPVINSGTTTFRYGSAQNPAKIQASNSIIVQKNLNNVFTGVNNDGYVYLTAPHIDIKPGVYVLKGGVLVASNGRMSCEPYQTIAVNGNKLNFKSAEDFTYKDIDQKKEILVYPNPASDMANVKFKGFTGSRVNIRIYNIVGLEVFHMMNTEIYEEDQIVNIDLQSIQNGFYIVNVEEGKEKHTIKLEVRK